MITKFSNESKFKILNELSRTMWLYTMRGVDQKYIGTNAILTVQYVHLIVLRKQLFFFLWKIPDVLTSYFIEFQIVQ